MFYAEPGEAIRDSTMAYVKDFRERFGGAHFDPHVTLGFGESASRQEPFEFEANRLAICHVGNFNTCRRVLYECRT
jgi:hypothetical protein